MSEATGAAQNKGRAQVTGRGGTSGSGAQRSTAMRPDGSTDPGVAGPAADDATAEVPLPDEPQGTGPVHPEPARPGHSGPAPGQSWTSTVQPSGTAVNRSASPYGPGETRQAPQAPPAPPPPAPPPPGQRPGLRGRAAVARARAGKRTASGKTATGKSPRRAHLQVSRFEPWSVMKFSFVMSLVCFVVLLVAVTVLYMILSGLGVFEAISNTINDLTREQGANSGGLDAASWFSFARVFGYTALIGSLNVLLITALATVWAVIYNLAADFVGGVEVTLKEAE
ncbi:MAG TPA: DUF3566 domain-containing protein [Streptosporangiaceae bacterium]|nr:DUF3566 domain-containing protein [Streptosporangiaceae bacterium]